MRTFSLLVALAVCVSGAAADESEPNRKAEPKIRKISTGYLFTEGPALAPDGRIWFTDVRAERIYSLDPKTVDVKQEHEKTGKANGLVFDSSGQLVACEGGNRQVVRIKGKKKRVIAKQFEGKRFNSPNDLTIDEGGGIYFTDPRYGSQRDRDLDYEGVFYLAADGTLSRVAKDVVKPNGILLSKNGKKLYIADSKEKLVRVYDVVSFGKLENGKVFAKLDEFERGGPDGLSTDKAGHVYCAGQGHLWIWNDKGRVVQMVKMPEKPTNVVCVEKDGAFTLFVTARTSVYRVTFPMVEKK